MSQRSATYFERRPRRGAGSDLLVRLLQSLRLVVVQPVPGGNVYRWHDGERVESSELELANLLESGAELHMQLWYGPDHDLLVRCVCARGVRVTTVSFAGKDEREVTDVRRFFVDECVMAARAGDALGFVFDPDDAASDTDWLPLFDPAATSTFGLPDPMPRLVMMTDTVASKVRGARTAVWVI